MPVGLRVSGECFRHKADLDEGFGMRREIGVENAIGDGPIVDRFSIRILSIGVGGTPFESRYAVTRGE